jgi:hypothetical protein
MLLEEQMGALHDARVRRERRRRLPARRIGPGVRLVLANEAEPNEHAQAVRVRGKQGLSTGEEQDLLGRRLPDARKGSQRLLRRAERAPNHRSEIAAKVIDRDARALAKLGRERCLEDAPRTASAREPATGAMLPWPTG